MSIKITEYNAIGNLGENIEEIFKSALIGDNTKFFLDSSVVKGRALRLARITEKLPDIGDIEFNTRCNRLILAVLNLIKTKFEDDTTVIVSTTNTGVDEFEKTGDKRFSELSNPACFVKKYLNLKGRAITVSTACSSGAKAFSLARDYLNSNTSKKVIVIGVDPIANVPLFGFNALEILSGKPTNPFSDNNTGINIGEGAAVFVLEKTENEGVEILGIGENTDIYHSTTPNPKGDETVDAIKLALNDAKITPNEVDYINLHGTGTLANDIAEGAAINKIFGTKTPASSTKPLTGHCLGAASCIEAALCCHLLKNFDGRLFPHITEGKYNPDIAPIKLVSRDEKFEKCNIILSNSFGFGGTNGILVLGA